MLHRRASITDLAKELGLSASTISRALADHHDVSEATKARVRQLAKELNYHPNPLAAGLRRGRSNTLGVLVPHLTGHFFPQVIDGIATEARRLGFDVMICQSNEDVQLEMQSIELMMTAQVAGILVSLANTTQDFSHFEDVRQQNVPLVFFDRQVEGFKGKNISSVTLNDYLGAYQVVEHLLAQGCRRIAHLTGPLHLSILKNRHQGYHDALAAHGITPDPDLTVFCEQTQAGGATAMRELLRRPAAQRPDALFSSNDLVAVGALQVAKKRGLRIPHDLAVAGFSNEVFTTLTEPTLTTVDQRCHQMGETAVQLLQKMLPGSKGKNPPRSIVLKPKLIVRESSMHNG
ncbi:MAG: LacI family DNA-binding transcriptional regulator [Janthinobacterium lividum]